MQPLKSVFLRDTGRAGRVVEQTDNAVRARNEDVSTGFGDKGGLS